MPGLLPSAGNHKIVLYVSGSNVACAGKGFILIGLVKKRLRSDGLRELFIELGEHNNMVSSLQQLEMRALFLNNR